MALLTPETARQPNRRKKTVAAPYLGGNVVIQALNAGELLQMRSEGMNDGQFIYASLALAVLGEGAAPLFTAEKWGEHATNEEGKEQVDALYLEFKALNGHFFKKKEGETDEDASNEKN